LFRNCAVTESAHGASLAMNGQKRSYFSRQHRVAKEPIGMGSIVPWTHDFY